MSENGLDPKSVEKKYLKTFGIAWPIYRVWEGQGVTIFCFNEQQN